MQLTRGIFARPRGIVPEPPQEATFQWFVRPPGGTARCTFYTDGSRRDGHDARTARMGWSVVGLDERGAKIVEARGVPRKGDRSPYSTGGGRLRVLGSYALLFLYWFLYGFRVLGFRVLGF